MRIAKTTHLKRLLQTQDVFLGLLAYLAAVNIAWYVGILDLKSVIEHSQFGILVLIFNLIASLIHSPKLHGHDYLASIQFAAKYTAIVLTGMLLAIYFGKLGFVSRTVVTVYALLLGFGLIVDRLFLQWWYFKGRTEHNDNYVKVLVIGTGNRARKLMSLYGQYSDWGVDIVGMLDPGSVNETDKPSAVDGIPILGDLTCIEEILSNEVIDEVIVCLPRSLIHNLQNIVGACEEQAVCIKFMADLYDIQTDRVSLDQLGPLPILSFEPVSHDENMLIIKRLVDITASIFAIIALLPLLVIVAAAIKLDSKGPIFFKQKRVGLNKRYFNMVKFRSMHEDAEQLMAEIEHLNEAEGPIFKMSNDPRITRIGKFLRRSSIDELPQLLNVLVGHMSLIGPRPMSARDVALFSKGIQRRRFSVRPGLACLREISGRSKLSFERWLELDLQYIDEWSLGLDFMIMIKILPVVLKGEGAS